MFRIKTAGQMWDHPRVKMVNEYLLCVKAVDVQDPHLLDNRTLSRFSSPFDKKKK